MGPMATCVLDLKFFCETLFGIVSPDTFPLKYQKVQSDIGKISFAYCESYPFIDVSPVCNRAVAETIERLKINGHKVVQYKFPKSFEKLTILFYQIMSADGWKFYFEKLEGEKREENLKKLLYYASFPNWIKKTVSWLAGLILKDSRAVDIIKSISEKNVYQMHKIQAEIDIINSEFRKSIESQGIDMLIMPVHVLPATTLGSFGDIHFCAAHTFMWNLLNQPIGVMPVCFFDKSKDIIPDYWPRKFKFTDIFSQSLLDKASQHWYNPDEIVGLPAGIQVIGRSNEDEKVIEAMLLIEKLLK